MSTVVALREPGGETRAALTPEAARAITALGHRVVVQTGVGTSAHYADAQYAAAGAEVLEGTPLAAALRELDLLVHVVPLPAERVAALRPGTITLGMAGATDGGRRAALADAGVVPLAFEQLPRSSRAQTMDVLSSQALAAGYRAVLEAAIRLPRFFPLAMTAAGTVPPAKVVVLGVGVAGLQAIATARRLGASVAANDIRPDSAEEVRSVGATFIDAGVGSAEAAGGYARSLEASAAQAQQQVIAPHIAEADVLITTAAVPGRPAPRLVTTDMVAAMRPGSVVVDLAAGTGGNVEGSVPGADVRVPSVRGGGEVVVVGLGDAAGDLPTDASRLYAKNVSNVVELLTATGPGGAPQLVIDPEDDLLAGLLVRLEPEGAR
ncbi:NAD(P)(+) transhydrogenase (Re/Si-specific) subunit alpha [Pseudactinotalea suaedae]|uniref:NAD(P)(+) transhydrogenase (Re/Si-specific) subunit alpha n=1 Tax=Pseudactinotalea suaedae TaxID=1524924 RepID=UPI0012E169F0|nr:NAD(P)(+) transhydrogenase (Re/Si-specific) subunit alpha [Pseudactinotalea suaedae]